MLYGGLLVLYCVVSFVFLLLIFHHSPESIESNLTPEVRKYIGQRAADIPVFDADRIESRLLDHSDGRPMILSPIYTSCPGSCSAITSRLTTVVNEMKGLGTDFKVVTFSFDPSDNPDDLLRFRNRWELDKDNWKVVSADSQNIALLLGSIDFWVKKDEGTGVFNHANKLVILSPAGKIAKFVYGLAPNKFYLEVGLQDAMKDAFSLSFSEEIVLRFFKYDPAVRIFRLNWLLLTLIMMAGLTCTILLAYMMDTVMTDGRNGSVRIQ